MDKVSVYESLFQGRGTPIRCSSQEEVDQIIYDLCTMFPHYEDRIRGMGIRFGTDFDNNIYKDEIVFRVNRTESGSINFNFCTYDFYHHYGYEIVEFCDILAERDAQFDADSDFQDDWTSLYS